MLKHLAISRIIANFAALNSAPKRRFIANLLRIKAMSGFVGVWLRPDVLRQKREINIKDIKVTKQIN